MNHLAKKVHDARRPLNNISMQAELIKVLSDAQDNNEEIKQAANKIIDYCQACSEKLQELNEGDSEA